MNLIPAPYRWAAWLLAATVALGLAAWAGWDARGTAAAAELAMVKADHADQLQAIADAARAEEARQRAEEARRTVALQEIQDAATLRAQARTTDVRRAAVSGDGLRIDAQGFAASPSEAGSDSSPACGCPTDRRAAVLADLLADVELLGREMARVADEARDAGKTCEAAYASLTDRSP